MRAQIDKGIMVNKLAQPVPRITKEGELGAVLELILKDKDGRIKDHRLMQSRSFVRQFLQLLFMYMMKLNAHSSIPIIYTVHGGIGSASYVQTSLLAANAPINNDDYGILAGTGTTAVALSDFNIETRIAHGVGAGELQYSAMTFGAPANDGTISQFTLTRDFSNGSGGDITVNEVGLTVKSHVTEDLFFLALRDVIAALTVPDGETLTVNYRIQASI